MHINFSLYSYICTVVCLARNDWALNVIQNYVLSFLKEKSQQKLQHVEKRKNADRIAQKNYYVAGMPGEEDLQMDKAVPLPLGW